MNAIFRRGIFKQIQSFRKCTYFSDKCSQTSSKKLKKKLQLQSQIAVHCRKSRPKCTTFSNLAVVALEETISELKANTRKDEL